MREKIKNLISSLKHVARKAIYLMRKIYSQLRRIISSQLTKITLPARRNKFFAPSFILIILIVGGIIYYLNFSQQNGKESNAGKKEKIDIFTEIKKGELVGTFGFNEKARLGDLEITLLNTKEGSFRTLELDKNNKRIVRNYFGIQAKVFNTGNITTEILFIGLKDEKSNKYELDHSVAFYVDGLKDFGISKQVFPRTIREGYLFFSDVSKEAKKLQLIFYSNVSKNKIVFEFER
jgi:hypothetical protein